MFLELFWTSWATNLDHLENIGPLRPLVLNGPKVSYGSVLPKFQKGNLFGTP